MTTKELTPDTTKPGLPDGWKTEVEFAEKWNKSPRTIQRWRQLGKGPKFKELPGGQKITNDEYEAEWLNSLVEVG